MTRHKRARLLGITSTVITILCLAALLTACGGIATTEQPTVAAAAPSPIATEMGEPILTPTLEPDPTSEPVPQGGAQGETVTLTFELTVNGDVPAVAANDAFYAEYQVEPPGRGEPAWDFVVFCGTNRGEVKASCRGDGTVYTAREAVPAGSVVDIRFLREAEGGEIVRRVAPEIFAGGEETVSTDHTTKATYNYDTKSTLTFELTLTGDMPAGQAFSVQYEVETPVGMSETELVFCGTPMGDSSPPDVEDCTGSGTVYSESVLLDRGANVNVAFHRFDTGSLTWHSPFHEETVTLEGDTTINVVYDVEAEDSPSTSP